MRYRLELGLLCVLLWSSQASAQATGQLWTTATVDWLTTERQTLEVEVEPRAQPIVHPGQSTWRSVDVTPHIEQVVAPWIDLIAETDVGFKSQSDDKDSLTVTPRVGVQLHILSRILRERGARRGAERESLPRRRLAVHTLVRLEDQITSSNTNSGTTSSWQVRERFALAYPLNRPKTTADGAVYLTSDTELFMPVNGSEQEGLVNELRVRAGVGYRQSFGWRFEALYQWTAKRNETSGVMAVESHTIDVRLKRVF